MNSSHNKVGMARFRVLLFIALRKVWCIVYLIEARLRPPRTGNYNWEAVIFPKLMSWEILDRSQQHVSYFLLMPQGVGDGDGDVP